MKLVGKLLSAMSCARAALALRRLNGDENAAELVRFAMQTTYIRPYQIEEEFSQFASLIAARRPRFVMEIGTYKGGTLFTLSRVASSGAKIIYMDMAPQDRLREALYRSFPTNGGRVVSIIADSHQLETLHQVKAELQGHALDVLFIDGDHSYEGVRRDFEMYGPLVREGGLVAFHDIAKHAPEAGCYVDRLWAELKQLYPHQEIMKDPGQDWAGIGILFV